MTRVTGRVYQLMKIRAYYCVNYNTPPECFNNHKLPVVARIDILRVICHSRHSFDTCYCNRTTWYVLGDTCTFHQAVWPWQNRHVLPYTLCQWLCFTFFTRLNWKAYWLLIDSGSILINRTSLPQTEGTRIVLTCDWFTINQSEL